MAEWDTAYINDLPDSHFLYIEPGGRKDAAGKTVPRELRHLPSRNAAGAVDGPHLRNAAARLGATKIPAGAKDRLRRRIEELLAALNRPVNDAIRARARG